MKPFWKVHGKTLWKFRWLWLMALPGMLLLFMFSYVPLFGVVVAFKQYQFDQGIWGSEWVGLQNFQYLFDTRDAWIITRNTLFLNSLFILFSLIVSVAVALCMNEVHHKVMLKFVQTSLFVPYFISWVIVGYFGFAILNFDTGTLNRLLNAIGIESVLWYSSPEKWPAILVITHVWKSVGYFSIIYFAGLMGINHDYYEAARIDGATKWQQIRNISIPLLSPLIVMMTLLQIGQIFNADFGLFYNVTLDTPLLYETTDVIDTYVFRSLREIGDIGMASAAGFYQAIVGFVLVLGSNWIVRRLDREQALF